MLEIFTTREIALGIYLICFCIVLVFAKATRKPALSLAKCVFNKFFVKIYFGLITYSIVLVYFFQKLTFWKWIYLKDVILWVLFVGIATCIKACEKNLKEDYFKNIVLVNIEFATITEFLISNFTFSLFWELVVQFVLIFIAVFRGAKVKEEKLKPVEKFFDYVFSFVIFIILVFTVIEAIDNFSNIDVIDLIITFCIPIVFSMAFLPIAYLVGIHSKYQSLFIRILHIRNRDEKEKNKKRKAVFSACGLSYKKLCAFEKGYYDYIRDVKAMYDDEKFYEFVNEFKK